ncbi:MAG: DUF6089 family protein [Ferruginibacter sp.]
MKKYLVALLLAGVVPAIHAQRIELGVTGGGMYYMGDLNPEKLFELTQPAFGFVYRYNFNNRVAVRSGLLVGNVRGDDLITQYRVERGLNFSSDIYEASVVGEFNFFDYFTGSSRSYISPYIFGGVGAFMYNPKAVYNSETYVLRDQPAEGIDYNLIPGFLPVSVCFPFGIGVKYSVNDFIGLTLEWGMRKTMTDYIDDVHGVYPAHENDDYPRYVDPSGNYDVGMQRGNSKDNDWYGYAGASVVFRINFRGRARCDEPERIKF